MGPVVLASPSGPLAARRANQGLLDASLRTLFDDLSEGVLVLDGAGQRVYSNPALNDLVGGNACLPSGTPEPPGYVPPDQRPKYLAALKGTSSLLTMDGSGTTSTWMELSGANGARVRTRVTISAFSGPRGWHFAVWLFGAGHPPAAPAGGPGTAPGGGLGLDGPLGWEQLSAVESLTRREKDVLELLLDGRRVSSIARSLYLSPQTVRNHLKAIFRKLGAHSQVELLERFRPAPGERTAGYREQPGRTAAPLPARQG